MPELARGRPGEDQLLMRLIDAILRDDTQNVAKLLVQSPSLARQSIRVGATRQAEMNFFFEEIGHYLCAGDTPLHAAAAGYRLEIARELIKQGPDVSAMNRRGAQPLHYAADGSPGSRRTKVALVRSTERCVSAAQQPSINCCGTGLRCS